MQGVRHVLGHARHEILFEAPAVAVVQSHGVSADCEQEELSVA
jgi:hypothetical protein